MAHHSYFSDEIWFKILFQGHYLLQNCSYQDHFFMSTKRKNLLFNGAPSLTHHHCLLHWLFGLNFSLCWFNSLLHQGSVLNYCFLGQFLNRGFSSTLEWTGHQGCVPEKYGRSLKSLKGSIMFKSTLS